ncbi:ubiquitin carboxyl-terminal hydrolase 42 [Austrofundulus limnaeus]|uniref:Ubiquitin carboxyl-terminal hydrolase 42 n=1 Tax=Austrofundulus limnaeus TaxID=52670 RepID=A0A2I4ATT3_AUSLI|nr:PREDICTED: ubiquitin carboxyl-terminal hydrolase 42-like [Austrofundulus limnaeus]
MTADKLSEKSDHKSVVFNRSSPSSGDLGVDASCSSCLAASPMKPSDSESLKSPGDGLDLTPDAAACSSASSVDQPNKQDIAKHFRYTNQEDAHEFLQHTVQALQQSCLPESFDGWESETQPPFIHQVFRGCLRSRVCCLNCSSTSDKFEPFLDLPLDVERASSVSSSLEQFVMPEELEDYRCSNCKEKDSALKTVTVDSLPNVLTLPLKRFDCNGDKVSKHVNFPENINMRPFTSEPAGDPQTYSLYAVLVHSGSKSSEGHYFCYVKASSGQWYKMDDSSVSVRSIRHVLKRKAYVLFYIRSDLKSDSATKTEPVKKKKKKKRKRSENEEHPLVIYYKQLMAESMREIRKRHCGSDVEDSELDFPAKKRFCTDNSR